MAIAHASPAPWIFGIARRAALQPRSPWQYNRWLLGWRTLSIAAAASPASQGVSRRAIEPLGGLPPSEASQPGRGPMSCDDSDRSLVERVKNGDVRAFEVLHRRYHPRIYRFAYLKLGNAEDAADVAANTFCRALRHLPSYQFRRTGSLYPWLHQIASNLVVDVVRAQPPGGMLSLDAQAAEDVDSFLEYLPSDGPDPQELVERAEVQEVVREAINRLPADQGKALALRFLGDLSIKEIAQTLDRSEGAVKSLLHRALQSMRNHLKNAVILAGAEGSVLPVSARERSTQNDPQVIHLHSADA